MIKIYIFSVLALFLATPALAHVEYSEAYQTCMDAAEDNVTMTNCMSEEADRLEPLIEEAYTAALTRAMDQDQAEKEIRPDLPELSQNASNLQKSQDAFKAYIAAEYDRRMYLFGMGSGAGAEYLGCLAQLRKHRIDELGNS